MPPSRSSRTIRGGLNMDLNDEPTVDNPDQVGTSIRVAVSPTDPIDLDDDDDDDVVIVSSPRAFAEAKNKSKRNHELAGVVDVDVNVNLVTKKRRRGSVNQTCINSGILINLEVSVNSMGTNASDGRQPPQQPPKERTFSCPICMGQLVEEMSTKCGHIFCKDCINIAIAAQKKCPTCRKRVTPKDIMRVYLPPYS